MTTSTTGGAGNDTLVGGSDADILTGGGGSDFLNGGSGTDTLDGGTGIDRLLGGSGSDRLIFKAAQNQWLIGAEYTTTSGFQVTANTGTYEGDATAVGFTGYDSYDGGSGSVKAGKQMVADQDTVEIWLTAEQLADPAIRAEIEYAKAWIAAQKSMAVDGTGQASPAQYEFKTLNLIISQVENIVIRNELGFVDIDRPTATVSISDPSLNDADDESVVTITFSEEVKDFDNSDVTVLGGTLSNLTSADGGKTWTGTFTATDGFEGTGSVTVTGSYTDLALNVGATGASDTVAIDTKEPDAPVVDLDAASDSGSSDSDDLTHDKTPTLTITAEAGSTVEVFRDGVSVGFATETAAPGVFTFTSSELTDEDYVFTATATDAAGNTSNVSGPLQLELDTTLTQPTLALTTDTGSLSDDELTKDGSITFNDADADATRVITVDGDVVASYDPSLLDDGPHTVVVTDTDAAGNEKSASLTFTLDTTLTQPTLALTTDTGSLSDDELTKDGSITFNDADADATRVITVDGDVVASYDPSLLDDGPHTVVVTDTDAAGNEKSASLTFTLDTTLTQPTLALTTDTGSLSDDELTKDGSITFNDADADATRVITVDGDVVASYDPSLLDDGPHTVVVTDTDAAGNEKSASLTFTLDTDADVPPVLSVTFNDGDGVINAAEDDAASYTVAGLDGDAGATVTFSDGNSLNDVVVNVGANGTFSADLSGLTDGPITASISATDTAGNTATGTGDNSVKDTVANVTITGFADDTAPTGDGKTTDTTLAISGTAPPGSVVTIKNGTTVLGTATANAITGAWTFNTAVLAAGIYAFTATGSDAAGNTGTSSTLNVEVVVNADPNDFDNIIAGIGPVGTGDGNDNIIYGSNDPTVSDNIDGNNGNDTIYGRAGNDTLNGNNQNDVIYGGSGNDTISGNNGDDDLYGGSGNDVVVGGGDLDEIIGGFGADTLTGNGGDDIFRFWGVGDGGDTITDFSQSGGGGNDKFEFRLPWSSGGFSGGFAIANQATAGGATMNTAIVTGVGTSTGSIAGADVVNFTSATTTLADSVAEIDALLKNAAGTFDGGVIVVAYDASGNVAIYYDADANSDGGVVQLATLTGVGSTATLGAGDFFFIA